MEQKLFIKFYTYTHTYARTHARTHTHTHLYIHTYIIHTYMYWQANEISYCSFYGDGPLLARSSLISVSSQSASAWLFLNFFLLFSAYFCQLWKSILGYCLRGLSSLIYLRVITFNSFNISTFLLYNLFNYNISFLLYSLIFAPIFLICFLL